MTMYSIIYALQMFLRILSAAIFVYWILTFLRFNNRFVEILAKMCIRDSPGTDRRYCPPRS